MIFNFWSMLDCSWTFLCFSWARQSQKMKSKKAYEKRKYFFLIHSKERKPCIYLESFPAAKLFDQCAFRGLELWWIFAQNKFLLNIVPADVLCGNLIGDLFELLVKLVLQMTSQSQCWIQQPYLMEIHSIGVQDVNTLFLMTNIYFLRNIVCLDHAALISNLWTT